MWKDKESEGNPWIKKTKKDNAGPRNAQVKKDMTTETQGKWDLT